MSLYRGLLVCLVLLPLAVGAQAPTLHPVPVPVPEDTPTPAAPVVLRLVETRVHASDGYMVKPIFVSATLRNDGRDTVERVMVRLTLTPQATQFRRAYAPGSDADHPEPSVFDPTEQVQAVENLYPGRSRTVEFQTQYYAASGFSSSGGFFEVPNLAPNIKHDVLVNYRIQLIAPEQDSDTP